MLQRIQRRCFPTSHSRPRRLVHLEPSRVLSRISIKPETLQEARQKFFHAHQPVILTNFVLDWPAIEKWKDPKYFASFGRIPVPVDINPKQGFDSRMMPLNTFVAEHLLQTFASPSSQKRPRGEIYNCFLFDQLSKLRQDIIVNPLVGSLAGGKPITLPVWIGSEGRSTPLEVFSSTRSLILCQVSGERYVKLYHPTEDKRLYPFSGPTRKHVSQVDVDKVDEKTFPLFSLADFVEGQLGPGDALFVPAKHWLYARNLSYSAVVGLSFELSKPPSQ